MHEIIDSLNTCIVFADWLPACLSTRLLRGSVTEACTKRLSSAIVDKRLPTQHTHDSHALHFARLQCGKDHRLTKPFLQLYIWS